MWGKLTQQNVDDDDVGYGFFRIFNLLILPKLHFLLDIWWLFPVLCTRLVTILSGHLICKIVFLRVKSEHSILIGLNHVWNSIWDENWPAGWFIPPDVRYFLPEYEGLSCRTKMDSSDWSYLAFLPITSLSPRSHLPAWSPPFTELNYCTWETKLLLVFDKNYSLPSK